VSQGTVRPTVDISHNVIASSHAVDADTRVERTTRDISPIVASSSVDVHMHAAPSPFSRYVDSDTHSKRLYAAAHAPLAPPTTPIADLLCHERDTLSFTSSDSDNPPTASQRENRPPLLGTHSRPPSPLSVVSSERSVTSRSLYQLTQLATQLATTVQDQLKCTRDDAEHCEQRMINAHAEREYRLLSAAAERDRRAGELEAQRDQLLVLDAQRARDALLADVQLQRDREA